MPFPFLQMVAHGPSFASLKYNSSPEVNYADSVATMGDMAYYFAGPAVMQTNQPKSFMSSFHIVTPTLSYIKLHKEKFEFMMCNFSVMVISIICFWNLLTDI